MAGHYYYVSIIFHGDLVILTVAQKRLVFDKQIADFYISTQLTNILYWNWISILKKHVKIYMLHMSKNVYNSGAANLMGWFLNSKEVKDF